jgi:hypothetical protein
VICSTTPAGRAWPRLAALSVLRSTLCTVSAPAMTHYGAQSHTPRNRCVRFVAGVAVGSRNTRFQAACSALPGSDFHRLIAPALLGAFTESGQNRPFVLMPARLMSFGLLNERFHIGCEFGS